MRPPDEETPLIGITCDLHEGRARVRTAYASAVRAAGGTPVLLPPLPGAAYDLAPRLDGLVLTGGDDPIMEPFGRATHREAKRVHPERQAAELAILDAFERAVEDGPVLGVCLGMQYMALCAGGDLNQHLPETHATAADHAGDRLHPVTPGVTAGEGAPVARGEVASSHHQAVSDPGALRVVATAHDGVIEAIDDPSRAFYLGVQWHPERTEERALGQALFDRLVEGARRSARARSGMLGA